MLAESINTQSLKSWKTLLGEEKQKDYFKSVIQFVEEERKKGKIIYPINSEVFSAFQLTPFEKVKVVILGQDPYHGPNQAHGLCFSVKKGVPPPPSLLNIYKELESDVGFKRPNYGLLESWANEGVLLLNSVLTVENGKPGSHANKGWETFTDFVIQTLNENTKNLVFLLWGSYAQKKGSIVDKTRHLVLEAPHPSPLSAHRGFLGCRHFSKTNEYLYKCGKINVNWSLTD